MTVSTAVHHILAVLKTERELPEFNATLASVGEQVLVRFQASGKIREYHGTVIQAGTRTLRIQRDNGRQSITVYAHGLYGDPRIAELGDSDHEVISVETETQVLW